MFSRPGLGVKGHDWAYLISLNKRLELGYVRKAVLFQPSTCCKYVEVYLQRLPLMCF